MLNDLWYDNEEPEVVGQLLQSEVARLLNDHSARINKVTRALSAYDNLGYDSAMGMLSGSAGTMWGDENALTFNVLQSSLDTLLSKIGKNKLLPRIITTNAKWAKKEQATKAEKFVRGLFRQLDVAKNMEKVLFSSLLHGDGFLKVVIEEGSISLEPCLSEDVLVDFADGMYGTPECMFHVKWESLDKMIADYPEMEDELKAGSYGDGTALGAGTNMGSPVQGKVCRIEAWKLPYKDYAGSHAVSCGSVVLVNEDWDRPYFPFIHMQYQKTERGYYCRGMHHALAPLQKEINFTFRSIAEAQRICGSPKVFVVADEDSSPIEAESSVTNRIGEVLRLKNVKNFQIYQPPPLNGERFGYLSQLKAYGFEQTGISQLSATSRVPAGVDGGSGKALREYNNIETERFALFGQEWERAHGSLGEMLIRECARNPEFMVKCYDRKAPLEVITYQDLGIEIDKIVVDIFPASALPAEPTAKFAAVMERLEAGFIDKKNAIDLLDMPDLDAHSEITNSPKKAVDKLINFIIEKGKKLPVEPFMDLQYLAVQATNYYSYVYAEWNLEKRRTQRVLDALRMVIEETNTMLESLNPPPEAAIPAVGGTPEMAGLAAAGMGAPPGVSLPPLPPEASALLGGVG